MYTKLFGSIIHSTVWREPDHVRLVWITMLAISDRDGIVEASIPGLADAARQSIQACEDALQHLLAPDPWSRTKDHQGRRIEAVPGGWRILNHGIYRAKMNREEQREKANERMRRHREKVAKAGSVTQSDACDVGQREVRQAETETKAETEAVDQEHVTPNGVTSPISSEIEPKPVAEGGKPKRQRVPFADIVALYHEALPELPRCEKLTPGREGSIRQRWVQDLPDLADWRNFFQHVRGSRFLMGLAAPKDGHRPFRADLEWLTKAANFAKIAEGKYHQ